MKWKKCVREMKEDRHTCIKCNEIFFGDNMYHQECKRFMCKDCKEKNVK